MKAALPERLSFFRIFAAPHSTSDMIKYEDLTKQLKAGQFKPVYLLHGEEPFYIDCICSFFENHVLDEADRDFNQSVLYGKDVTVADVLANAKQFPFGAPYRVVILKEAKDLFNLKGSSKSSKGEENASLEETDFSKKDKGSAEFAQLQAYAKEPTQSTILVICYKYKKLTAAQCKPFEQHGEVFLSEGEKDWNLSKWILKQAGRFHFTMDDTTATLLAEHIGNDLSRINSEFEKLRVILPNGGAITPDVVEKYIGISKEYNIFELQDALGNRNEPKAYKITLNFAQHLKENPNVKTILMLFRFYNNMLRYHLSPDKSSETTRKIFGNLAFRMVPMAQKHSIAQLTRIISLLREYDMKTKGLDNNCEEGELLKELIYKILH